jgi:polar amino acid transport system substrate-binding protein
MKVIIVFLLIFLSIKTSLCRGSELTVVTESYPPFVTVNNEKISGIVTNKVKDILAKSQLNYKINAYPWARSYQIAMSQPNTLIYSIIKSPERSPYFHWFCPIFQSSSVFAFKLSSNPTIINSISSLQQTLVGTARLGINHELLQKHNFELGRNLDISATEDINLKKLINGRVDAVVQSLETLRYRLDKLGFNDIKITQGVAIDSGKPTIHCMALNVNSDPVIVGKIKQAFQQYQQTNLLK